MNTNQRSQDLKYRSDNIVDLYVELMYTLTAKEQFSSDQIKQIKSSLLAKNTSIETLEYFLNITQKLESKLRDLLEPYRIIQPNIIDLGSKKKSISNTARFPNKLINVSGRANIIAKTFPNNSLFVRAAAPIITEEAIGALSVQTLAPVAASMFFGLTEAVEIPRSNADEGAFSLDVERIFNMETIVNTNELSTDEEFVEANARMQAALQRNSFAPIANYTRGNLSALDELDQVNNLLTQYGGATLESMITKVTLTSEAEILNKEREEGKFVTKELQASIIESIVLSDNSETFEKEIEEKYKETFTNKEALKEIYSTVKTTLAVNNTVKKAKTAASFKDKVLQNKTGLLNKEEKAKENQNNKKVLTEKAFIPMTIGPKGLQPVSEVPQPTIVIYKKQSDNLKDAILTDNVVLLKTETVSNTRARKRQNTRRNNTTTNRNQTTPSGTSY